MRTLLLAIAILLVVRICGQTGQLYVFGDVQDQLTHGWLRTIDVEAVSMDDSLDVIHGEIGKKGKFELYLPLTQRSYRVLFKADSYLSKHIIIDMHRGTWSGREELGMQVRMTLLRPIEGVDSSILNEPTGISRYDPSKEEFIWDMDYWATKKPRYDLFMEAYMKSLAERR